MVRWEPRRTTGYAVGMVTDSHISASVGSANVLTSLDWLRSQTPKPRAILHAGDINEKPEAELSFSTWITEQDGWPDPEIEFLYTIGGLATTAVVIAPPARWRQVADPTLGAGARTNARRSS